MAPKLSCSELKKLQVKRRRLMTVTGSNSASLKPLPSLTAPSLIDDSGEKENAAPVNPFAKKSQNAEPFVEVANISLSSLNTVPSSMGDFLEADFFGGLEKKPSNLPILEDVVEANEAGEERQPILTVEKSLKTSVIIESPEDLSFWQRELCSPDVVQRVMHQWGDNNIQLYFRYPDASLPAHQKKLIHKALNHAASKAAAKADETLAWYRQFSETWRKALLSVFEGLKLGTIGCFYFLQDNMTVLFERSSSGLKAYMKLTSLALAEDFKSNGITYSFLQQQQHQDHNETTPTMKHEKDAESEAEDDDGSNSETESTILLPEAEANVKLKRAPIKFEKQDIYLEGSLTLAELVDYLINQKDRNSFAILPEIYAPGPFVYGTLRRNELTATGACRTVKGNTVYQFRLNGIIFPRNLSKFLNLLGPERISSLTQERQPLTDFLSVYPFLE